MFKTKKFGLQEELTNLKNKKKSKHKHCYKKHSSKTQLQNVTTIHFFRILQN